MIYIYIYIHIIQRYTKHSRITAILTSIQEKTDGAGAILSCSRRFLEEIEAAPRLQGEGAPALPNHVMGKRPGH